MSGMLVLTHGLPGAGKSSLAAWLRELYPDAVTVAERDELRAKLLPPDYHDRGHDPVSEAKIEAAQHEILREALDHGRIVVVSDTNLAEIRIRPLVTIARRFDAAVLHAHLDYTVEECKRRNQLRADFGGRFVPGWVIDEMVSYGYAAGRLRSFSILPGGVESENFAVLAVERTGSELTMEEERELIQRTADEILEAQLAEFEAKVAESKRTGAPLILRVAPSQKRD